MPPQADDRVRLSTLRRWTADHQPFPLLTCYDATTARWLWRGGVRVLLVGDTAGQFILGFDSTLPVGMDFMVQITAAVRRGAPSAFVMADMPFGSYQCGEDEAVSNAIRFLTEGGADAVKLEVDASFVALVGRLNHAGVPVVAHLGSRPQLKRLQGGSSRRIYRSLAQVEDTVQQGVAMAKAGAVMLLFEAVPAELTQQMKEALKSCQLEYPVPIIGCGAGPACDGHVVVLHDLLGLTDWHAPFAKPMAQLGQAIEAAAAGWGRLVGSGQYLRDDHPYKLSNQAPHGT